MGNRFIINTITFWYEPPRARHQLAYALSKQFPVIFVSANKIGLPRIKLIKENKNLDFYIPYFPIDYRIRIRIPWINLLYQRWLLRKLRKEFPCDTVINFDFTAVLVSKFFDNSIYYCNDDHIGISKSNNINWIAKYQEECEKIVAKNSRFCIGTSGFLKNKLEMYNKNTFEIRLGAPHIQDISKYSLHVKKNLNKINVGIVGYISTIDFELMEELFENCDLFFTLIGPINKKLENKLASITNVNMTGSLIRTKLYEEVNKFDVGLIPYRMNSKIDRTPNKLWLYLALGKPVVISNINGIKNWKFPDKFIYRSNSNDEFLKLIRKANEENDSVVTKQRMEFAQKNSWDSRAVKFLELHNKFIA